MRSYEKDIAHASEALYAGRLDDAVRLLSKILKKRPRNALAHNLAAIAHLQSRNAAKALAHAQRAVDLDPENFRYRSNLGAVLMFAGQADAAMAHFDQVIAGAPNDHLARQHRGLLNARIWQLDEAIEDLRVAVKHNGNDIKSRLALAEVLIEVGKFDEAQQELRAAEKISGGKQSARWQYIWGRCMYRRGRFGDAQYAFNSALHAEPGNLNHYVALACASFHYGDLERARKITRATFAKFPSASRQSGKPELRVLVLEALGHHYFHELPFGSFKHWGGNFIAHMPAGRVAYTHAVVDGVDSLAGAIDLGQFDLAYSNMVVHELLESQIDAAHLDRIMAELPMPVINRPELVTNTARDSNARKFATRDKFVFPRTIRIDHDLDRSTAHSQVLEALRLPVILRPLHTHVGVGAKLVRTERELEAEIARRSFSKFYAIEYHDCQSDDGLFRRYRIACVDGRLLPNSLHVATDWNVHSMGREALDWYERGLDREEEAFRAEPGRVLKAEPEDVFKSILENTALDIYGFDFGMSRDGRIVVFEVNAAMALGLEFDFRKYPYRKSIADELILEIENYFLRVARAPDVSHHTRPALNLA